MLNPPWLATWDEGIRLQRGLQGEAEASPCPNKCECGLRVTKNAYAHEAHELGARCPAASRGESHCTVTYTLLASPDICDKNGDFIVRKIKILFVTQPTVAGVAYYVYQLAKYLDHSRYEVVVVSPENPSFIELLKSAEIRHRSWLCIRSIVNPLQVCRECLSLIRIIRDESPDIIHCHSSKAGAVTRLIRLFFPWAPPIVYTPNSYAYFNTVGKGRFFYRLFEKLLSPLGSKTIAVSQSERDAAIADKVVKPRDIVYINNGLPMDYGAHVPPSALVEELRRGGAQTVIASVARLSEQKNPLAMIECAGMLLKRDPSIAFVLVGDGPLEDACRSRIEGLGIGDNFKMPGFMDHDSCLGVVKSADIYLQTSLYEGMPYSILGAMSLECAVVATDVIGNRDLIEHGNSGLLCPPCDLEAIVDSIMDLILHPDYRHAMARRSRSRFLSEFTIEPSVRKLESVYDELVKRSTDTGIPV